MKKLILSAILAAATTLTFAQNNKVVTAFNYHKYYVERGGKLDDLMNAKAAIDEATQHAQTMGNSKTWYYRGQIYHAMVESKEASLIETKDKNLQETVKSYLKTLELDSKKEYSRETLQRLAIAQIQYLNLGVEQFENKKYVHAANAFEEAVIVAGHLNKVDTLALYNAALAAEKGNLNDKAIAHYERLIQLKYGGANTYIFLSNIHKNLKQDDKAQEVIKKGRTAFPDDKNLIIEELNYYLIQGKLKEAISNLELAVQADPANHILIFSLGSVYDNLANPDKEKTQPTPAEYTEYMNKSEASYKKALEVKPDYFDAIYNLGALYFNQAVKINDQSQNIKDNAVYAKEIKKSDDKFALALPYLEKAHELDPKDRNTLISLKQLYARTQQADKYKKIKELLEN
ncbi:MAG: tetratricopeptide repeat protein [Bacteroidetes bacterium]|nr:tetratricopeptide repeat protein [Bacteroidota bacterium]HET6244496.1 tetratricopeptide repeat protein [Bacteroidia bacterium]